jgi:hypothetical protein
MLNVINDSIPSSWRDDNNLLLGTRDGKLDGLGVGGNCPATTVKVLSHRQIWTSRYGVTWALARASTSSRAPHPRLRARLSRRWPHWAVSESVGASLAAVWAPGSRIRRRPVDQASTAFVAAAESGNTGDVASATCEDDVRASSGALWGRGVPAHCPTRRDGWQGPRGAGPIRAHPRTAL